MQLLTDPLLRTGLPTFPLDACPPRARFARPPDFVDLAALELAAAMRATAPDVEVRVLQPGEGHDL